MTTVVVILGVLAVVAIGLVLRAVILTALEERRQRRRALQRSFIVQAANSRMRAASHAAVGAMLRTATDSMEGRRHDGS